MSQWIPRYKISSIMLLIFAVALSIWFLKPFKPNVSLHIGGKDPEYFTVLLTNTGPSPVWFCGYDHVASFSYWGFPAQNGICPGGTFELENKKLTELRPQESIPIYLPCHTLRGCQELEVRVPLFDWRGRRVEIRSPRTPIRLEEGFTGRK